MGLTDDPENYVTIFDSNFVLSGLALHESLLAVCKPFRLWIVAMDPLVAEQIERLQLATTFVIRLEEVETAALRAVKRRRTAGEYCWTLTPFLPEAIFKRAPEIQRVTYIDADLFFFSSPRVFFSELECSGKDVLITRHAYAPEYDRTAKNGRFCVQFVTFGNTAGARRVLGWWQARCLEWCYARYEDGKFGDQKYLDSWPDRFASQVHVLEQVQCTLAPWNVDFFSMNARAQPVFYHLQGFRVLGVRTVKLYHGYKVARRNLWIYDSYLSAIVRAAFRLSAAGFLVPTMPEHHQSMRMLRRLVLQALGRVRFVTLPASLGTSFTVPMLT